MMHGLLPDSAVVGSSKRVYRGVKPRAKARGRKRRDSAAEDAVVGIMAIIMAILG